MQELLYNWFPNVMAKLPDFYEAIGDTLLMVAWSGVISFVLGLALGVLITVTGPGAILENKVVYQILDKLISLFRSIPFIILLTWVLPISRAIMGTAIYVRGAIVPLVFGAVPFFARQVESALAELDPGLVEAALSMGSGPAEIIVRVYLKESVAAIARGTTITAISLLNLTAMAGVVGAGGLGDFAIRYGHDRNMADVTNVTVAVLVIIVCIIEFVGGQVVKKNSGTTYNALAESAVLEGTTRTISRESRDKIRQWVSKTAWNIADIYGGAAELQWTDFASPLVNDPQVCLEATGVIEALWGSGRVVTDRKLSMSGDNFAEFLQHVPGAYAYLGTGNPSLPNTLLSNHNGEFDVDEEALALGAGLYAGYALSRLEDTRE